MRRDLVKVFGFALSFRLVMLLALLAVTMLSGGDEGFQDLAEKFTHWDAKHYINLIEQGYIGYEEEGKHLFLVFYPLYVWIVRLVRLALPHTAAAGVTVSTLSYAWGCCYVYRIAARRWGRSTARDAVTFLSLYPFGFFFGMVMTEGLFLLATSAACYYAMERKWLSYGIWGALAALTRMTGILVIVPAVIELLEEYQPLRAPVGESLKKALRPVLCRLPLMLLPLLGALGYLGLNWAVDGKPFAFTEHQAHWNQGGMWISQVLRYIWDYFWSYRDASIGYAVWLPELLLFVVCFLLLVLALRREDASAGLLAYSFCYLCANYSLSWLLSGGRYLSCGFPFFLFAAQLTQSRPNLRRFLFASEAVFLGVYFMAYLNGAHIM